MTNSHWNTRILHWDKITPPMRPHKNSINAQVDIVGNNTENVLLLGVTPELAKAFDNVTAVDIEPKMIEHIWPGDDETHKAILGDWFTTDLPVNHFSAVVGDGSLNMVKFPFDAKVLMSRLLDLMRPGGIAAVRVFSRPETPVLFSDLISNYHKYSWHAFRCYLNMYLGHCYGTNIPSKLMLQEFDKIFPDRQELSEKTGWDINEIGNSVDAYRNSMTQTSYPTQQHWMSSVPDSAVDVQLVQVAGYELAEHYPILTFRKPI